MLLHPLGKSGGRHHIMPPKGYLCWCRDRSEVRLNVVRDHRIGLLKKGVQRLDGSAPDKLGQRLDVIRLGGIEFRGKTPGKNAQNDHLCYIPQTACHDLPALNHCSEEGVGFRPATM